MFNGVKIIDITKVFSGPFATRMLADYGAEVIKVESLDHPDDTRSYPPLVNNWSGYYEILNRNKKNISLELTEKNHLQILLNLCVEADVFVENLSPQTKHKLKIDYDTIKQINPTIIYASLSGLGQNSNRKYYDLIAQAESGLMSLSGRGETPMKIGPSVVDAFSGMTLAFAIAGALFQREKTGEGTYLDVSMIGCAMNLLEQNLTEYSITKNNPHAPGNLDTAIAPFGIYRTKTKYIALAAGSDSLWNVLCETVLSGEELDYSLFSTNILRVKNNRQLTLALETRFQKNSAEELLALLTSHNIPCSLVATMEDTYNNRTLYQNQNLLKIIHPQLGECVVPGFSINLSQNSKQEYSNAHRIGQDNQEYGISNSTTDSAI